MTASRTFLRSLDQAIIIWIAGLPGWIRPIMEASTILGQPWVMSIVAAALITGAWWRRSTPIATAGIYALIMLPLSSIIKILVRRVRPETANALGLHTYSFPSGHAFGSMLVLGLLAYLAKTRLPQPFDWLFMILLIIFIISIGISRIYLGAHYPTDVLAGWTLGAIVLVVVIRLAAI